MRPAILNPLFTEVEALRGIGAALSRPLAKLGLARVVDILFHLPVNWIDRTPVETLDMALAGQVISVTVTPVDYRFGRQASRSASWRRTPKAIS